MKKPTTAILDVQNIAARAARKAWQLCMMRVAVLEGNGTPEHTPSQYREMAANYAVGIAPSAEVQRARDDYYRAARARKEWEERPRNYNKLDEPQYSIAFASHHRQGARLRLDESRAYDVLLSAERGEA